MFHDPNLGIYYNICNAVKGLGYICNTRLYIQYSLRLNVACHTQTNVLSAIPPPTLCILSMVYSLTDYDKRYKR